MAEEDALIREIESDVRRDRWLNIWKDFGGTIIALSLSIIALTAGVAIWQSHRQQQHQEATVAIMDGQMQFKQGKWDEAMNNFKEASKGGDALGRLADIWGAKTLFASKQNEKAAEVYSKIAERNDTPAALKELALLQQFFLTDLQDAQLLEASSQAGHPFSATAKELLALSHLERGEVLPAMQLLKSIEQDVLAPPSLRKRAKELIAALDQPSLTQ